MLIAFFYELAAFLLRSRPSVNCQNGLGRMEPRAAEEICNQQRYIEWQQRREPGREETKTSRDEKERMGDHRSS